MIDVALDFYHLVDVLICNDWLDKADDRMSFARRQLVV